MRRAETPEASSGGDADAVACAASWHAVLRLRRGASARAQALAKRLDQRRRFPDVDAAGGGRAQRQPGGSGRPSDERLSAARRRARSRKVAVATGAARTAAASG